MRTTALGSSRILSKWLVEHDRGEPMRAQKAHVCYACGGAIPAGEQYRRLRGGVARINVKGPRGVLPGAPPGDAGLSLGSSVSTGAGARPSRPRCAGCDWYWSASLALVPPEYLRRQPDAPELMRRFARAARPAGPAAAPARSTSAHPRSAAVPLPPACASPAHSHVADRSATASAREAPACAK